MSDQINMNELVESYTGSGKVVLIAGGGKVYTDIAARFVRSERELEDIIASPYSKEIVKNIISSNHRAALEFDWFIFGIDGYSRVTEAQLIRKRLASYLIKSGRAELKGKRAYQVVYPEKIANLSAEIVLPDGYKTTLTGRDLAEIGRQWYEQGVAQGYPEEDLRYLKPMATNFKAIVGMNVHSLLDWFAIRTCFDNQTEVLTTEGWKFFNELTGNELFYSMDKETRIVHYVKAKDVIKQQYNGNMIVVNNRRLDLCTTPNHNNLVSVYPCEKSTESDARNFFRKSYIDKLQFITAEDMANYKNVRMTRTCKFVNSSVEQEFIEFPEVDTTRYPRGKIYPRFKAPVHEVMQLMGFYISDGSLGRRISKIDGEACDKRTQIAKGKYITCYKYAKIVSSWLGRTIYPYTSGKNLYVIDIYSPQLYDFFEQCGTEGINKCIPRWVWDLPQSSQQYLLLGLLDGDSSINYDGHGSYYTISKSLADDFQRLLLHCGLSGSIKKSDNNHVSEGVTKSGEPYKIQGKNPIYTISFTLQPINSEAVIDYERNHTSTISYNDFVYCVELEKFNTLYVRRNGFPVWSGNCKNAQHEIRDLAMKMMKLCKKSAPDLFVNAGPSCVQLGYCPENKLQNTQCKSKIPTKDDMMLLKEKYWKKD